MSRVHVLHQLSFENDTSKEYLVFSSDFNDAGSWEKIGLLQVDLGRQSYVFHPLERWASELILPPNIFDFSDAERIELERTTYKGAKYGAWTAKIHGWAKNILMSPSEKG